ncbi:MAG TPA: hypothetical protein VF865_07450 [Acidobacteriaceae bacterium]
MAIVRIDLPDQLAQEAERAGLLSAASLEEMIRQQLQARAAGQLLEAISRMDQADDPEIITPEVAAAEISAMRAEKRAARKP